ncbi:MAG: 5-oxoprolinase subunit PxpB [Colwellia sp.]|nr:5-oxoprolinase subunit PxpB [Colwellia sp.]
MTNSLILTDIKINLAGENAVIIYFSEQVSPETCRQIKQAQQLIKNHFSDKIIDLVPSYASILIVYDQLKINHHQLQHQLKTLLANLIADKNSQDKKTLVQLPVYYSIESGPDLIRIASQSNISVNQVIECHSQQEYQVYAIGFAPGFAYLGEVNLQIATPRLTTPRLKVPKGAVGIADKQTAVYPSESPGGWNIIGLCPTDMFNANSAAVTPVQVGDTVKFNAISKQEFLSLGGCLPSKI